MGQPPLRSKRQPDKSGDKPSQVLDSVGPACYVRKRVTRVGPRTHRRHLTAHSTPTSRHVDTSTQATETSSNPSIKKLKIAPKFHEAFQFRKLIDSFQVREMVPRNVAIGPPDAVVLPGNRVHGGLSF